MTREILMATHNPHKKERFEYYLSNTGLSVVCFGDLKQKIEVVEDGKTPEENALKKSLAGFNGSGLPTFGVDYWFFINGVSEELQPGPFVRRIVKEEGKRVEATDDEMLEYYSKMVESIGGTTTGIWTSAIALVINEKKHFTERFTRETILTSRVNPKRTEGEPLNSMQIDPGTGKYFTDLTKEEWLKLQSGREKGYIDFLKSTWPI